MPDGHRADGRRAKAKRIEDLVSVEPGTLGDYALRYLDDLALHNYSPHTIRHAGIHLRLFLVWCRERGLEEPELVTLDRLRGYQHHLFHYRKADGRALSFVAQSDRLGGVRRFFGWMKRSGHLDQDPAKGITLARVKRRLPKHILTPEEAEAILAQPDLETPMGLRDRALLEVLYATGVRRGELEKLQVEDLQLTSLTLRVEQGKGQKDRLLPLSERAAAWVEKYLEEARPSFVRGLDPGALFLAAKSGKPLQGQRMAKIVRLYIEAAGVPKEGACHLFRHTLATLMLEGGADIRYVQTMLGHSTLQSTEIYTHVAIRKLQEVHARSHPAAKLGRRDRHLLENPPR